MDPLVWILDVVCVNVVCELPVIVTNSYLGT